MPTYMDSHSHLGERPGGTHQTSNDLLRRMDQAEVERCYVLPWPETEENRYIGMAVQQHGDRFVGFACANPWKAEARETLERTYTEYGLRHLYLNPVRHGYPVDRLELLDSLLELSVSKGGIVLVHCTSDTPFTSPYQVAVLARAYPRIPFVLLHMGLIWHTDQAITVAHEVPNAYLSTAGATGLAIRKAVNRCGANKVLWGTDTPFNEFEVERLKVQLAIGEIEGADLVLGGNAERLANGG